jgi:hypothetical protein
VHNKELSLHETYKMRNLPGFSNIGLNGSNINSINLGNKVYLSNWSKFYILNYPFL